MLLNSRSSYQREWLTGPPKYTDVLWLTFADMDMARNNLMQFWDVGWDCILAGWKDVCEVNEESYNNNYKTGDIKHEINNFINRTNDSQRFLMLESNLETCRHWISTTQHLVLSHLDFDNVQTFHIKRRLLVTYNKTTHSISSYLLRRYTFTITTGYKN